MSFLLYNIPLAQSPRVALREFLLTIATDGSHAYHNEAFKIIYFVGGAGELLIDRRTRYTLAAGDLLVIPKACHQRYLVKSQGSNKGSRLLAFVVTFRLAPDDPSLFAHYLRETFPAICKGRGNLDLWDLFVRLRTEGRQSPHLAQEWIHTIATSTAEALGSCTRCPAPWHRYEALASHWAATPGFPIRRPEPGPPFASAFTRHFGLSPGLYARKMLVERAKVELAVQSDTIKEIANDLGFTSAGQFSQTFRLATALSPSAYRRGYVSEFHPQGDQSAVGQPAPGGHSPSPHPLPPFYRTLSLPTEREATQSAVLLIACRGDVAIHLGDAPPLLLQPAEALLLPAETHWHAYASWEKARKLQQEPSLVRIDLQALPPFWEPSHEQALPLHRSPCHLPLKRTREAEIIASCAKEGASLHSSIRVAALVRTLLLEKATPEAPKTPTSLAPQYKGLDVIGHTKEYIANNYRSALSLGLIAQSVGVSTEHLSRRFRAETGQTVFAFLKEKRLSIARQHLSHTDKTLAAIAEESGFSTTALFCRTFKEQEGLTPGAFRKNTK